MEQAVLPNILSHLRGPIQHWTSHQIGIQRNWSCSPVSAFWQASYCFKGTLGVEWEAFHCWCPTQSALRRILYSMEWCSHVKDLHNILFSFCPIYHPLQKRIPRWWLSVCGGGGCTKHMSQTQVFNNITLAILRSHIFQILLQNINILRIVLQLCSAYYLRLCWKTQFVYYRFMSFNIAWFVHTHWVRLHETLYCTVA